MQHNPILQGLADNPTLMQAVRDLLEKKFSVDTLQSDQSDMVLGQMVRARLVGLKAVEEAFKELAQHKSRPDPVDKNNPAY